MRRIRFAGQLLGPGLFAPGWIVAGLIAAALAAALLAAKPGVALAHTDEYFDQMRTPHGGQVRMAGPYHLELVVAGAEVTLYVNDHADNPIATADGSAKVIIRWSKRNRYVVVLAPAGENVLRGTGEFKLGKANEVSVLVALPGREPQRAKFRIDGNGKPLAAAKRKAK
jgi:hypothetical protein